MNDQEIKAKWNEIDDVDVKAVCDGLHLRERKIQAYLCDVVASLCGVESDKLMTSQDNISIAHARWLYWYAYRFLTNETYEKIAANIEYCGGFKFRSRSITSGVNKMAVMVDKDDLWKDRWRVLKHIIGLRDTTQQTIDFDSHDLKGKIVLLVPKDLKNKVEIRYKE